MTDVKICGLTRAGDVALACELGARYLGFNFSASSPRRVDVAAARALASEASAGVARVGVFVDENADEIRRAVDAAGLDLVQLHRPLRPEDVEGAPWPVIAVARVRPENGGEGAFAPPDALIARCAAVLFDAASPDAAGGTGRVFDWGLVSRRAWPAAVFLAGGLVAENVGDAIERVRPAAVDVASGVESAPGIKDPARLARFFRAVEEADALLA